MKTESVLVNNRIHLKRLELLDLRRTGSIGDIVSAFEKCAFTAAMVGETAKTWSSWLKARALPVAVYDGKTDNRIFSLLKTMKNEGLIEEVVSPAYFVGWKKKTKTAVVIGTFSERHADALYANLERAIYINPYGIAPPGLVRDGYYPDVIFADPYFSLSLLAAALGEWQGGKAVGGWEFLETLDDHEGLAGEVKEAAKILELMVKDPDCTVLLTVSGAMTPAQMSLVICDMIDLGMVDAVLTTGAAMAHGLVPSIGLCHYKYDPRMDDVILSKHRLNRITTLIEPETNFDAVEEVVDTVFQTMSGDGPKSSIEVHRRIGEYLSRQHPDERGILKSAFEKGIPVCSPAFQDSEVGNDKLIHNLKRKGVSRERILVDQELDTLELIELIQRKPRMAIFHVGGGTPGNHARNLAPLIEIVIERLGADCPWEIRKIRYGVKIAPDQNWLGSYGGCTWNEAKSWRKAELNGRFADVHADATLVWPIIVKAVMEKL
ncbi:MAG: deoxyhypusine synthase family protein [Patescibacteria group bacterium]